MILHALPDSLRLRSSADIVRENQTVIFSYYLTDPSGNRLTDPSGNYLIAYAGSVVNVQILHSLPDDWKLNSE